MQIFIQITWCLIKKNISSPSKKAEKGKRRSTLKQNRFSQKKKEKNKKKNKKTLRVVRFFSFFFTGYIEAYLDKEIFLCIWASHVAVKPDK